MQTLFSVHLSTDSKNNVIFNVTNTSSNDYYVCSYGNPLESPAGSQLIILDKSGAEVPYKGMEAKRMAPEDCSTAWVLIPNGQTISQIVDLSSYRLKKGMDYVIELNSDNILYSSNNNTPVTYQQQGFISNKISYTC